MGAVEAAFATRPATPSDFAEILRLNAEWQHVTSPLDELALARLDAQAAAHRVAVAGGRVIGFALALREGADYASPNYRWFARAYDTFLYVDRVVVARAHQRAGVGSSLYDDLIACARALALPRVVCEIDAQPPNAVSDAFHTRRGFVEVGSLWIAEGAKRVSLRSLALDGAAAIPPRG